MLGKRRHSRIAVPTGFVKEKDLVAYDLSESGMGLGSASPLSMGAELTLTLDIHAGMAVNAKIMWCRESASVFEQGYRVGVEFSDMSTQDMLLIRAFVQEHDAGS